MIDKKYSNVGNYTKDGLSQEDAARLVELEKRHNKKRLSDQPYQEMIELAKKWARLYARKNF